MLIIHCNKKFQREREYIYDVVFHDFWGVKYQICFEDRDDVLIEGVDENCVYIEDTFFQQQEKNWLRKGSLPNQPLETMQVLDSYIDCVTDVKLPVIYGNCEAGRIFSADNLHCYIDIFGSAFFMLTRYEEVVIKERDCYDRFSAANSLAYQEGFLERPIINEYLEILWQWLGEHFVGIKREERRFEIMPTHDIDVPFWRLQNNLYNRIHMLAGDVLKRRDWSIAHQHIDYIKRATMGSWVQDPYYTFDLIMDISERNDLTSNFYFMTSIDRDQKDGNYDIMHPEVCRLAKNILERGHKIGIHPGFGSKDKLRFIKEDTDKLWKMIDAGRLPVEKIGGRQHYLHWTAPTTWKCYEEAGIVYDTTLSYADHIGFRCGICYDYPVYNVLTHERYKLREYPLMVMDCSGLEYMNLSHIEMLERCLALKEKVRNYGGVFVILWHNNFFVKEIDMECYRGIIESR